MREPFAPQRLPTYTTIKKKYSTLSDSQTIIQNSGFRIVLWTESKDLVYEEKYEYHDKNTIIC